MRVQDSQGQVGVGWESGTGQRMGFQDAAHDFRGRLAPPSRLATEILQAQRLEGDGDLDRAQGLPDLVGAGQKIESHRGAGRSEGIAVEFVEVNVFDSAFYTVVFLLEIAFWSSHAKCSPRIMVDRSSRCRADASLPGACFEPWPANQKCPFWHGQPPKPRELVIRFLAWFVFVLLLFGWASPNGASKSKIGNPGKHILREFLHHRWTDRPLGTRLAARK
jgi:hypothetical protein